MATLVGMRIGTLRATVVGAVVIALSGCIGGDPLPTLPPTPTATPIFASEEEALAAAEEAYAAYGEVSDLISSEGGLAPERIAPFVTKDQLARELDTAAFYRERGWRSEGRPLTVRVVLQQYDEFDGVAEVLIYVCLDVSEVRIRDQEGADVTPANRPSLGSLEVGLVGESAETLLVASSEQWSDSSFC